MKSIIYPRDFESKLGFDQIRLDLKGLCASSIGRNLVEEMKFSDSFEDICVQLERVNEMKSIIESGVDFPKPVFHDLHSSLSRIKVEGGYMTAEELYKLLRMLEAMKEVREFYCMSVASDNDLEEKTYKYPVLAELLKELEGFPLISRDISMCINKFGEVVDNASEELYEIRKSLVSAGNSVARAMRRAIDNAIANNIVSKDVAPAMRDGRMVIPVEAGLKRSISGIIHDESSTGKTVYIEPSEVVEASNRVKELKMEEHRAIVAILVRLADMIRPSIDSILDSLSLLGLLDFIMAKGKYAVLTGANMPVVERNAEIDWYSAFHPVLFLTLKKHGRAVVPLNLSLNQRNRFLIVSGPNAGGKSVVLKTVGIVQYMTQCGLLPTLNYNSHVGIFNSIFIDIGDEQSLENDLSTYSSHLKNMKFFMSPAQSGTLILADEMGSGTEPQIGGALAQSILDLLSQTGCLGIVTTHYQNLKTFADEKEGFVNGAMQYDRGRLQPTFNLLIGHPGSSFALEIAKNIGLPAQVIDRAKEIVGSDYVNTDKYLLDIDRDRRYWSNKRQQIKEKESKLNDLLVRYEDTAKLLKLQRAQILNDAKKEAKEILASTNAKIESTIKEIRDVQAEKERTKNIRKELEDYKRNLENKELDGNHVSLKPLKHKSRRTKTEPKEDVTAVGKQKTLCVGDYVRMSDGGVAGRILSIQGKNVEVAFGSLRTFVNINKLQAAAKPKETSKSPVLTSSGSSSYDSRKRQLNFKTEIDVRGLRADEAIQAVSYFIDDAIQFEIPRVRILHGTGHGILRTLIREQLNVNNAVKSYGDEDVRYGGAGITVVNLS